MVKTSTSLAMESHVSVFSFIKPFLTVRSQKVAINSQLSGALVINAGVLQELLRGSTLILIQINDLHKNILRSFMPIIRRYTGTPLELMTRDCSLSLIRSNTNFSVWKKNHGGYIKCLETKLITKHHCRSDHELPPLKMNRCTLEEVPCLENELGFKCIQYIA